MAKLAFYKSNALLHGKRVTIVGLVAKGTRACARTRARLDGETFSLPQARKTATTIRSNTKVQITI